MHGNLKFFFIKNYFIIYYFIVKIFSLNTMYPINASECLNVLNV